MVSRSNSIKRWKKEPMSSLSVCAAFKFNFCILQELRPCVTMIDAKMIDQLSLSLPVFVCTVRPREQPTLPFLSKILDRRSISNDSADFPFQFMTQFLLLDSRWNRVVSNVLKRSRCSRTGWILPRMRRPKSHQRTRQSTRKS